VSFHEKDNDDPHVAIQNSVGFDFGHPFDFWVARSHRGKRLWLTKKGEWKGAETIDYPEVKLSRIYPLAKGLKLHY
jgi:hypothetical protein